MFRSFTTSPHGAPARKASLEGGGVCGGLREPAAHRCWKSYLQHPLHDPGRVVADLVVGKGSCAYAALEFTCTAVGVIVAPGTRATAAGSVINQVSVYPHWFLIPYTGTTSA